MNSFFASAPLLFSEGDFLQLRYRADVHTLTARWQRPVTTTELRQGYAAILQAAEAAACSFWLVDLRGRTMPAETDAHWLTDEFLPQLPVRLGGAVYLGYLLPPHFAHPAAANGPTDASVSPLAVRYFDDEGALTQWLAQCQEQSSLIIPNS